MTLRYSTTTRVVIVCYMRSEEYYKATNCHSHNNHVDRKSHLTYPKLNLCELNNYATEITRNLNPDCFRF